MAHDVKVCSEDGCTFPADVTSHSARCSCGWQVEGDAAEVARCAKSHRITTGSRWEELARVVLHEACDCPAIGTLRDGSIVLAHSSSCVRGIPAGVATVRSAA